MIAALALYALAHSPGRRRPPEVSTPSLQIRQSRTNTRGSPVPCGSERHATCPFCANATVPDHGYLTAAALGGRRRMSDETTDPTEPEPGTAVSTPPT